MSEIIKEIEEAFYDIPFENSDFQFKAFVVAQQITPARAYRIVGIQLLDKIRTIKEFKFNRQLSDISIEEKKEIINSDTATKFDKLRAQVEIDKIESSRTYEDKLLNDAIHSLNVLYAEYKKFPKYTREEFEAEEIEHFTIRLQNQIEDQGNGSIESIKAMNHMKTLEDQLKSKIPSINHDTLQSINWQSML